MQTRLSANQTARINGYINSLRYSEKVAMLGLGNKLLAGRLNSYLPKKMKTMHIHRSS